MIVVATPPVPGLELSAVEGFTAELCTYGVCGFYAEVMEDVS